MLTQLQDHINSKLPFLKNSKLLIAISGGIDSLVLTHLCHKLKLNIALAHCNFNLRGKESDADEDFVLDLAEKLDLEVFIENFDTETFAKDEGLSIQMAARALRYFWFNELSEQLKFDYILTAHHADDNLETFLINFSRGTGLDGLTGIPEVNENIVRPMLPFSRDVIEAYAKENHLKWREDSSNASTKYLRNKLRHDVIPTLKEMNPQLLQNFQSTLSNLNDTAAIVEDSINAFAERAIATIDKGVITLKISEFKKVNNPKGYLFELFKGYGFTEWQDVLHLLDAQSGKQVLSKSHRLIKDRDHLLLSKIQGDDNIEVSISEEEKEVETPFGMLFFEDLVPIAIEGNTDNAVLEKENHVIFVDKALLQFPLILRKWEEGDVFYPLGMNGKKKLSKYFKDEKLSLLDKENVWLLCSGNDIVWVINLRGDNRFKVTMKTKQILKIQLD